MSLSFHMHVRAGYVRHFFMSYLFEYLSEWYQPLFVATRLQLVKGKFIFVIMIECYIQSIELSSLTFMSLRSFVLLKNTRTFEYKYILKMVSDFFWNANTHRNWFQKRNYWNFIRSPFKQDSIVCISIQNANYLLINRQKRMQ